MRGVGGPLLCISDLLNDVGEDNSGGPVDHRVPPTDATDVHPPPSDLPKLFQLYSKDASKNCKLAGPDGSNHLTLKEPSANIVLLDYISSEKWKDIIDFDDHLDDISK